MRPGHGGGGPDGYRISGGRTIAKTRVVDDSGSLDLVFFNMEHRRDALHQGDVCVFFGKVEDNLRRKQMINPLFEPEGRPAGHRAHHAHLSLTAGVTQGLMARAAARGWTPAGSCCRTCCRMRCGRPTSCVM